MAQSTTNLGKIHVFPSEALYNQFKDIIADNDLALLKDDGAYIVAALLEQNGYVKFSNGLILQWGNAGNSGGSVNVTFPISFTKAVYQIQLTYNNNSYENPTYAIKDTKSFSYWSKYGGNKLWLAIGA